ncbi:hypothetical protein [Rhodobacter capsulatus]|uniref:hypothetical protein n=1 Tax=Rhodobacter capsulatus TaxID=1061 RepID=UPI0003D2E4B7|nr:hypothetical protein [Rhodobacter capsulatus]ETD03628.1 hypothetical protein U714_00555 [Rhodobacter capsulatus DE442]ETD80420.1 hypothetical protein U717_00555 [Rhodobacter capsulatus R121]ETE55686.1 hypothetical protein U715_00555 [Rhodobacter capsulatus Y262]MDS0925308.1 hypothetical protein [Rhodobacter capsulatus]
MTRFILTLGVILLAGAPAAAQQIAVRSGEHETFSRLVFMLPPGTAWTTERVAGGYRLTTPGQETRFDLSRVFDLIPKTRILSVTPDVDARSVFIETPPSVHLESFPLAIGAAVIDIVDGPETTPPIAVTPPAQSFRPRPNRGYLDLYWSKPAPQAPAADPAPETAAAPPAPVVSPLALPDRRVSTAERDLVDQLGRAASQGLITMELPKSAPKDEAAPGASADPEQAAPPEDSARTLALQSETVIDRDTAAAFARHQLSESGHSCPPDQDFDILSWQTDKPAHEQLTDARRDLIGEFDRPRPEAVLKLARVYVAFGFGAEAKATLRSFGISPEEAGPLPILADIIEGNPHAMADTLSGLTACDGKVALWAVLAQDPPPRKEDVNFGAVLRAYSALPPNIRGLVGPALSTRLIDMGAPDVAATVRSMLARAPKTDRRALAEIDARIDLSAGRKEEAARLLDGLALSASPAAAEALSTAIETKLSLGVAIPATDVDNAGALGRQLRGSETGARLIRAEVLGLGSTARFDEAFRTLSNWDAPQFDALKQSTQSDLADQLGKVPDDALFIETFFRHRDKIPAAQLEARVQVALADRLSATGFWQSARDILSAETRRSPPGRLALARAALAGRDAAAAYSYLGDLPGDEAAKLRGEAMSMLGRHSTAEGEFAEAGQTEAQLDEAWRAGNWTLVAQQGSETQKRFVELFAPETAPPDDPQNVVPLGPLSAAQQLISQSQSEREAFAKLMEELKAR